MTAVNPTQVRDSDPFVNRIASFRRTAQSKEPTIFTSIYQEETNIVVWQRDLSTLLQDFVKDFLVENPRFEMAITVTPQDAVSIVSESLGVTNENELSKNIAELVDMFCYLFNISSAGLRLTALNQAMCPKFHVDRVPCRLVTTYQGAATEWLPHDMVDRKKLGLGMADNESGIYQSEQDIQQLSSGDVALLKGEAWIGNENGGLVHRSPSPVNGDYRLLLTLDFSD